MKFPSRKNVFLGLTVLLVVIVSIKLVCDVLFQHKVEDYVNDSEHKHGLSLRAKLCTETIDHLALHGWLDENTNWIRARSLAWLLRLSCLGAFPFTFKVGWTGRSSHLVYHAFVARTYSTVINYPVCPAVSVDKVAILVEPRPHPLLEYIIREHFMFLGKEWGLQVFYGTRSEQMIRSIVHNIALTQTPSNCSKAVKLTALSDFGMQKMRGKPDYTTLFVSKAFWRTVAAEHVLIFQLDSLLRKPVPESMLGWAYVGAPWHGCKCQECYCTRGGNGGLSLRLRSVMITHSLELPLPLTPMSEDEILPEDEYFSGRVPLALQAPYSVGDAFSVEYFNNSVWPNVHVTNPVGVHMVWSGKNSGQSVLLFLRETEAKLREIASNKKVTVS